MEKYKIEINELILAAGGGAELAYKMGFDRLSGRLRVGSWKHRQSIPPDMLIAYDKLFRKLIKKYRESKNSINKEPKQKFLLSL